MRHIRPWLVGAILLLFVGGGGLWLSNVRTDPIRIGILQSLNGSMALHERPLVEAVQFAVEEINQSGGLLGRPVEAVVADCGADSARCAQEAERLIGAENVRALFGCWQVFCRAAVQPVVERHRHLLFYPLRYEGMDQSPNIVYLGATPNQQLIPAVRWALDHLGKRFYLIGSDAILPRTANLVVTEIIQAQGGQVLAERYLPREAGAAQQRLVTAVDEMRRLKPDVVIDTIDDEADRAFFALLVASGMAASHLPVISTNAGEIEARGLSGPPLTGHYAVRSYFQALPGEANQRFVAAFRQRHGAQRVITDPMETAYAGVKLWSQAVQEAHTDNPAQIGISILKQSMEAPEGIVSLNKENRHLWRNVHIGRARADGQFDILWSSSTPVCPEPYPAYRSRAEWDKRLRKAGLR